MLSDYILYLVVSGAIDIIITDVSYAECNLLTDDLFRHAKLGWLAVCEPVSGVTT